MIEWIYLVIHIIFLTLTSYWIIWLLIELYQMEVSQENDGKCMIPQLPTCWASVSQWKLKEGEWDGGRARDKKTWWPRNLWNLLDSRTTDNSVKPESKSTMGSRGNGGMILHTERPSRMICALSPKSVKVKRDNWWGKKRKISQSASGKFIWENILQQSPQYNSMWTKFPKRSQWAVVSTHT